MTQLDEILARGRKERRSLSRLFLAFGLVILVMMLTAIGSISIIQHLARDYQAYRDISLMQMTLDEVRIAEMILMREKRQAELPRVLAELEEFEQAAELIFDKNPSMHGVESLGKAYSSAVRRLVALMPQFVEQMALVRNQYFVIRDTVLAFESVSLDNASLSARQIELQLQLKNNLTMLISAMADSSNRYIQLEQPVPDIRKTAQDGALYLQHLATAIAELEALNQRFEDPALSHLIAMANSFRQQVKHLIDYKVQSDQLATTVVQCARRLSEHINLTMQQHRVSLKQSKGLLELLVWLTVLFSLATLTLVVTLFRSRQASLRVLADLTFAVREAQAAADTKARFLATMSHEIRTPMNAIIGLSQLALKEPMSEKLAGWLRRVHQSAHGLLHLLNDILDVSKVEAGKLVLETTPLDLHQVLAQLNATAAFSAQEKGLNWQITVAPGVPANLLGDPLRLGQILQNLVSNAIKFTHKGNIQLDIRALSLDDQQVTLEFAVSDTGVGIAPSRIESLFQPFDQGDPATTRHYGGTGLGLAISQGIAAAMGGKISVTSLPGKGSRFALQVTLEPAESLPPVAPKGCHQLNGKSLFWQGSSEACPPDWRPWLALQGLRLIHCDHHQSADLLVALDNASGPAPAQPHVVLHSCWREPHRDGLTLHLNLPVSSVRLAEALSQLIDPQQACNPGAAPTALLNSLPSGKRVLLVEDNEINQELILGLLAPLQWHLDLCGNGLEALEQIKRQHYDLILMDCHMPVMDGFDAASHIKAEGRCQAPLVAMSAYVLPEEKARMRRCGFDDSVDKPIQISQLQAVLSRWLPVETPPIGADATPDNPSLPDIDGIDMDAALQCGGGQFATIHRALTLFADQLEAFAQLPPEPVTELRPALHSLKGVAGNLGAKALYWQCHQTEQDLSLLPGLQAQSLALSLAIQNSMRPLSNDRTGATEPGCRSQLVAALRCGDGHALTLIQQHTPDSLGLSQTRFRQTETAIHQFDFDLAIGLIENPEND
ncbi:response regulator [Marinobacter hydrocarbonoclasticus]|nr:response regulator [Marinobacter nauticus]